MRSSGRNKLAHLFFLPIILSLSTRQGYAKVWGTMDFGAMTCSGLPETECGGARAVEIQSSAEGLIALCSNQLSANSLSDIKLSVIRNDSFGASAIQSNDIIGKSIHRVLLKEKPSWTNSAVWSQDGKSIVVADIQRRVLMQYSANGDLIQTVVVAGGALSMIQGTDKGGFLIEAADGGFLWVDERFGQPRALDLKMETVNASTKVTSVMGWTTLGDNLITFGDIESKESPQGEKLGSALLKVSHHSPVTTERMEPKVGPNARRFFSIGYPLLASVGERSYVLLLDSTAKIVEIGEKGSHELVSFPAEYRTVPSLPSAKSAVEIFGVVEMATTAISLVGWRDMLYVITRKPLNEEHAQWTIWPIEPHKDKLGEGKLLPTQAAHILVIPGKNSWAIIEKGPVSANGQDIPSIVFIDSAAIEASFPGIHRGSATVAP